MITNGIEFDLRERSATADPGDIAEHPGRVLQVTLRRLPAKLTGVADSAFPLLDAVRRCDPAAARTLVVIGALVHRTADERRTAEYLLRNRARIASPGPGRLLAAARCAAEMDVRRVYQREVCVEPEALLDAPDPSSSAASTTPSVGEHVVSVLEAGIGESMHPLAASAVLDAVTIFMGLSRRHGLNGGVGPSVVAMRPSARADARLSTHLRQEGLGPVAARRLARLLIGADGTSADTGALWWAARNAGCADVPGPLRDSWRRDVAGVTAALVPVCGRRNVIHR